VRGVQRRAGRIDLREVLRDVRGDDLRILRIDQEMRIAERVDVALGAVERRWDIEHLDATRCRDASGSSDGDFVIA
jgi:hypothetical protein